MAPKSFRDLIGVPPSTATPTDSTLIIIDAQNEYASGALKTTNVASTRKAIKSLLDKYRDAGGDVVHVLHQTPQGAPVFTLGESVAEEMDELKPVGSGEKVRESLGGERGSEEGGLTKSWGRGRRLRSPFLAPSPARIYKSISSRRGRRRWC